MRFALIFSVLILFSAIQTYAQFDKDKLFYAAKAERYKRMKTTGTILTIAGGILTVVGITTLSNSSVTTIYGSNGQSQNITTGNPEAGAIEFLLGIGGLGAGIPLWAVGGHAERKYLRKLENISVRLNRQQQNTGFTLTYKF